MPKRAGEAETVATEPTVVWRKSPEEFIDWANEKLLQPITELKSERQPDDAVPEWISEKGLAYHAGTLMLLGGHEWLEIRDDNDERVGYLNRADFSDVIEILKLTPFLGEEVLSQLVPEPAAVAGKL